MPTADEMDAAVAEGDVSHCWRREQHPWDSSAAAAAIAKIGSASDKLGVSSRSSEVNVRFPIPPEYLAKVDLQASTPKAAKSKQSGSPCARGALPADTKVQTPEVQEFQPFTAEVCDERIWKTADGNAPFQA